ncbi:MAG: hypothetical protein JWM98_1432 [Thermoleophilia bacterium]|nr:hypothetical protein [Thermoleophilia bacterium]
MTLYLDSSAWTSRYRPEEGRRDVIRAIVASHRGVVVASRLVELETERALRARSSAVDLDMRLTEFRSDLAGAIDMPLTHELVDDAFRVVRHVPVRSLDALHIAAVRKLGRRAILLTFDQRQAEAARELGVVVAGV